MFSSDSGANQDKRKVRKDKIVRATKLLNEIDDKGIYCNITFHFSASEGIVQTDYNEKSSWRDTGTKNENKVLVFNASCSGLK